jgi:LuxR family maltose regulon positive regulatory protein
VNYRPWLDVHELDSDEARRQLELLVMRAPDALRVVLATRHDIGLALHRLRLAALSLAGHPDPARFTAEFSGSERTVAEPRRTTSSRWCGPCC